MNLFGWMGAMLDQITFKSCTAFCLGVLGWLLGGFDLPFKALVALFLADYLLGFGRACYHKRISFTRMRHGILKFLLYIVAVAAANMLDIASKGAVPWFDDPARDFMVCYLAVCEFLSVSVHLAAEGVRMPEWLVSRIERFRTVAETAEAREVFRD